MTSSPSVAGWELGLRLRERRELMDVTAASAGKAIDTSQSYISGVESGKLKINASKLAELAAVLDFDATELEELQELREAAGKRAWWSPYSAMFSAEVLRYFGFEAGAESIRAYSAGMITSLLQTEDYAMAIMNGGAPSIRLAEANRRVEVRMKRQQRLDDPDDPLKLTTVITESALRQMVGGPTVMAAQLDHLAAKIDQHPDTIDVRVVPFSADYHNAIGGSTFYLLGFASSRLPELVWQETVSTTDLIDQPMRIREYSLAHSQAMDHALDRTGSLGLIERIRKEIE
ncbi:transcriptional regulator with XRE-family HTH domain [Saccharothrix ecbatanensis]|uniref:Transcriptional regulator with XRE-family HTH domain n=1 Tax=Saccharothrix ecbatanensis TaxID=1105145 RepID=A0A7W9LYA7_9PSEU|nr:helix-turn-helix transcriptional regulator [Saccharothrix ecbatanensis]MBB5800639.1 transcriptional regulator with XRE-family HTH domain [Saccharothrix ecbatanensis]